MQICVLYIIQERGCSVLILVLAAKLSEKSEIFTCLRSCIIQCNKLSFSQLSCWPLIMDHAWQCFVKWSRFIDHKIIGSVLLYMHETLQKKVSGACFAKQMLHSTWIHFDRIFIIICCICSLIWQKLDGNKTELNWTLDNICIFPALSLNMVCKTLILTAVRWTEMNEPPLMANWNSGRKWTTVLFK
jgi:hypothetical protein